jgi:hypothetical protein
MSSDERRHLAIRSHGRQQRTRYAGIVALVVLGASAPAGAVTSDEERCVTTLNRAAANVAATVAKQARSCLRDAALEKLSGAVADCFAADPRGRVARAMARTVRDAAQDCGAVVPPFGATDADTANAAGMARTIDLLYRILGGDIDQAVRTRSGDPDDYTCQQKVIGQVLKCQEFRYQEFNRCQQVGMRTGAVSGSAELAGCIGADLAGRVAEFCDPVTGRLREQVIETRCVAQHADLRAAFPGCATDDPGALAACLHGAGRCYSCLMAEAADGLEDAADCDLFDDGEVSEAQGSISPELEAMLAAADPAARIPVLIPLAEQADLSAVAITGRTKAERLSQVVAALKATAAQTQNRPYGCGGSGVGLIAELGADGADAAANIRSLWLTNAVALEATPEVITQCARRADVGQVEYAGPLPGTPTGGVTTQTAQASSGTAGTEPQWNIVRIRAPEVWGTLTEGGDVVVGIVGSGVDPTHPDLAANMLTRADGTPVWRDLVGSSAVPTDPHGQGTHLTGVAVGANGIGVAPGATWAACRAFGVEADGSLSAGIGDLVECLQFLMDPAGNGDSTYAADVIINPWWLPVLGCRHQLLGAVRNLRTANVLPVFAVGHPPGGLPGTGVPNPANYPEAFSVGASDWNAPTVMLDTSYRGIADCGLPGESVIARLAPRLFAPGVDVSSAWPGGGRAVLVGNPEGVAAAHVAGAAALILSAHPVLTVDQLDDALERTAALSDPQDEARRGLLDVYAAATLEDALFVDQLTPPTNPLPLAGGPQAVSVRMLNDGVTTWIQGVHHLMSMSPPNNTIWGLSRVELPVAVLPGDIVALDFDVTVPGLENLDPGYAFQWQMAHDGAVFGEPSPRIDVRVRGQPGAAFISQSVPSPSIPPNMTAPVSVTFRNTGSTLWDSSYGIAFQKPGNPWGVTRVWIPAGVTVPPCLAGTPLAACQREFAFTLTAPDIQGSYPFHWRMVRGTATGEQAFGAYTTEVPIPVVGTNLATLVSAAGPAGLVASGQVEAVLPTFRNEGTNTWLPTQYCVKALEPEWAGAKDCVTSNVSPNDQFAFRLTVTGPPDPGRFALTYQMHAGTTSFGPIGATTLGVTWDQLASAGFTGVQGQNYWSYRYYDAGAQMWKEMDWDAANSVWTKGSGRIWSNLMNPRDATGVARFWQSPVNGLVWFYGDASHFAGQGCSNGDGVRLKIKKNGTVLLSAVVQAGAPVPYDLTTDVQVDDQLRFIVKPRSNNTCDITVVDPFLRVLPPDTVGPIVVNPVTYRRDEPDDEPGTD